MEPDKKIPLHRQFAWQELRNQVNACNSVEQLRQLCHGVINHGIMQEAATEAICGFALVGKKAEFEAFPAVPGNA